MLTARACRSLAAAGLLWLAPAFGASAQTESDPIIVTGRTPEQTQRFVDQLSIAPAASNQLARWDNAICTSVVGLPARQGQFLADQIARRAAAVGLRPGAPGCTANVAIFVTADSDAMARRMFEEDASLFAYYQQTNVVTLGQIAFQDFLDRPRAVRWWHVAETVSADGISLAGDASQGGVANAPVARSGGSRLYRDTRNDFNRVIVIVDSRRVGAVQLSALADYLAMVTLAQIDPNADTSGLPTIMNLFAENRAGSAPAAMTDWDLAYLDGLYRASRDAQNAGQQKREIARRMLNAS